MKVTAYKKDETLVQLRADDEGILMEIGEHFTFFVDGYKFMPAYKNKTFDGKIRLFNRRNNTLPFGLLGELYTFCDKRGYELVHDESITYKFAPTVSELQEYVNSIPITGRGKKIEMRDYQFNAFQEAIRNRRSLVISSTGSGKSLLIYMMVRWFLDFNESSQSIVIIVPTTSLVAQLKKDFADYSELDKDFDAETEVHEIYSGKEKHNFKARTVIATWQTLVRLDKRWFENYGMAICDEAHLAKGKSINTVMGNLTNASYRIGTTGTLDGIQCNKLVLIGNFGPVNRVTSTKALMDEGKLAKLNIKCLVMKYPDEYRKVISKLAYKDEIDFIVTHEPRNRFITNLVVDLKGNTIVMFNLVRKHGKVLHKLISEKVAKIDPTRKVFFVSGEVETEVREEIRAITETEKNAILCVSSQTFSTGINIRNVHNIVFAAPNKSQIRVLQSIGRALRIADNGADANVYDISDDLSWKKKKNYTLNHAIHRVGIYDSEQFDYEMFEVPLN